MTVSPGREGLEASYTFFMANLSDAFIIILASIVVIFALHMIPLVGPLFGFSLCRIFYTLATLLYLDQKEIPQNKPKTK